MTELSEALKDQLAGVAGPSSNKQKNTARIILLLALLLFAGIVMSAVGIYVSSEPDLFAVPKNKKVTGYATTETIVKMTDVLLHKRGGLMSNDVFPPFVFLDNMPAWEKGVLVQIRDMVRALRKDIARSQSQSTEDVDLIKAEPYYNLEITRYLFPSSEDEYSRGVAAIKRYQRRLLGETDLSEAQYYARADNLRNWLQDVETRLGSISQRLSASVEASHKNMIGADDEVASSVGDKIQTPWYQVDDVFYEARGTTWALIHLLRAVRVDFGVTLQKKEALASLDQIIRELEASQETVMSPVILNGGGYGVFANHSLVMANYISRANAAIIDLRALLERG